MQVITLNQPSSTVPISVNDSGNNNVSSDICGKNTPCNELVYSMGTVINIGPPPDCTNTSESFQRSLTSPTERSIGGGKSNNLIIDLGPGESQSINPSSMGLTKLTLLQLKATCGDISVSFDCQTWFNVKLLLLDSFSPVNCENSSSHVPNIHLRNYYPPQGLTTCSGQSIQRVRIELILLGS